ncbi:GapA-binding peptide SR1P [Paenibacillus lemnae]|uniref:GapA-binding peptide SR1P n=1 Tax=Paenibacillus lemnae TaxID=1330551 RepID=A0A848M5W1_PAELE|nr:GapA-binding peptide SR1P [Paenibacillus lemnae]NMO95996.1 GapA-binding peptide SR1P [Paenibacillus lemnae]
MEKLSSDTGQVKGVNHDLGQVICSKCGKWIGSLPTNGVKIIHGYCGIGSCGAVKTFVQEG